MKKTKIIAGLMSAIMSGALAVVPTVYAEDDISVPFSVTIDNPDLTTGYFSVIFKNDYSKEMIENSIIPELINSVGEDLISNIIYYNTYYNADNFYTTDTTVLDTEYIERDVYIVELKSDDKVTAYDIETAFSKTGYFHYIDAVNFFNISVFDATLDDLSEPFTVTLEDNFIANKLSTIFKGKYTKDELENLIIPKLKKINGIKDFRYMCTGENGRVVYIIDLDFERDDKESAYNTAKALYDTGYFYSVEMNMISNMDSVEDEQPQIVTTTMPSTILKGDVNCDTEVDMSDAVLIMQALANPNKYGIDGTAENHLTEQGKLNGDMDGDGLTVGDAQEIQKKLLGLEYCTYVQYEKNIDWYYANLPSGVYEKCIGNGKSDVITTTDELKAYIYQFAPEEAVISYLEKYNDSFFKDNVLLIDSVNQTEGAVVGYVFDNVEITDKEINITIKKALSDWEAAPDLMSLCIFQIPVSKMSYNGQAVNWKK